MALELSLLAPNCCRSATTPATVGAAKLSPLELTMFVGRAWTIEDGANRIEFVYGPVT
jgi:hypothetical protein